MHVTLNIPDPNDPDLLHESETARRVRQNELFGQIDADTKDAKRQARLDYYFSQHPPNGPTLSIYRDALAAFVDSRGETPRWLTYPQLFASFARLEKRGVLKIEMTVDSLNIRHYMSTTTAKRRNVRPAELDAIVAELKKSLGNSLDVPVLEERQPVHGCRYVPVINKWRVSLFFGGRQHALGCYPFSTALRLQDVLAFHFSSYRRPAAYNTSEQEAVELLGKHLALQAFASALETHWLAAGVLRKPVEIISTECRLAAVEKKLDDVLKLMQTKAT